MYRRVVKDSYIARIQEEAKEAYRLKVTLPYNQAKEALILTQLNYNSLQLKSITHSDEILQLQSINSHYYERITELEKDVKEKRHILDTYLTSDDYSSFLISYEMEHFNPTEDDYETVKVANAYGIVEPDEPVVDAVTEDHIVEDN